MRDDLLAVELARGQTKAQAAKTLGISERTVYARQADPVFLAKVLAIRRETGIAAVAKLLAATTKGADRLTELIESPDEDIALRAIQAAHNGLRGLSELLVFGDELRRLNDKMEALARNQSGKKTRGRLPLLRAKKLPEP